MKHLRLYENFQTEQEIADICKRYDIKSWSINSEGLVDVNGNVNLSQKNLDKLPLKFGTVTVNFYCYNNKLTSLKGSPKRVGGNFSCQYNNLTSLEGGPEYVGGSFRCNNNNLTSLEGSPKEVGGNFNCLNNKLISLEGSPIKVGGGFYCYNNKLTNLESSTKYVQGNFDCNHNKLVSLEGSPDFVGGNFDCYNNPIFRIWQLFKDYSKIELFNYYDIIRELDGKPAIVLARLNQFLDDIGKQPVERVDGYINI